LPEGTCAPLVKFAPARKTLLYSEEYCCAKVYLHPAAFFPATYEFMQLQCEGSKHTCLKRDTLKTKLLQHS